MKALEHQGLATEKEVELASKKQHTKAEKNQLFETFKAAFKSPAFDLKDFKKFLKEQGYKRKNSDRNKPCFCGSGKKTKQCCWNKLPK